MSDLKIAINNFNNNWVRRIREEWIPEIVVNTMNEVRHNYLNNDFRDLGDEFPFVSKYFSKICRK